MNDPQKKHLIQRLMDNHWLLLVLGILIPFISYTLWAWLDIWLIKPAPLP